MRAVYPKSRSSLLSQEHVWIALAIRSCCRDVAAIGKRRLFTRPHNKTEAAQRFDKPNRGGRGFCVRRCGPFAGVCSYMISFAIYKNSANLTPINTPRRLYGRGAAMLNFLDVLSTMHSIKNVEHACPTLKLYDIQCRRISMENEKMNAFLLIDGMTNRVIVHSNEAPLTITVVVR